MNRRWFMNMFWGVNTIVKGGGEVDDIFLGEGVETGIPTSLTSYT